MTDSHPPLLRSAGPEDAPALGALWAEAFPGERTAEERSRALLEDADPYGGLEDARVAVVDGERIGAVRIYPLRLHLWGREYPTLGLGAVAVAPSHRRRGYGRRICVEAMRLGRERGDALSLLFPFRTDFYARLGYALVGERHRYRFRLAELADADVPGPVEPLPPGGWAALREVYEAVARRSNGAVLREERHWRRLERPEARALLCRDAAGSPTGYGVVAPVEGANSAVRTATEGTAAGGNVAEGDVAEGEPLPEDTVRIRELVALDRGTRKALLAHVARLAQEDGREWGEHDAFPSEAFHRLLRHPERPGSGGPGLWFESALLLRGPMLRILQPGRIATGLAELRMDDGVLPENRGRWREGVRTLDDPGDDAPDAEVAARLLASGALPGLPLPPEGWEPLTGGDGFHLREEF